MTFIPISHPRLHQLDSALDHSDFSDYLDQAVKTTSKPTFAGLILSASLEALVVGTPDLGTTSAELGNVRLADNKGIYFGNDQDFSIIWNSATSLLFDVTSMLFSDPLITLKHTTRTAKWSLYGGTNWNTGALFECFGDQHATRAGQLSLWYGGNDDPTGTMKFWIQRRLSTGTSYPFEIDANMFMKPLLYTFQSGSTITISGGVATILYSFHHLETEDGDATDDLDTITLANVIRGTIIILKANNDARTVVVKDGTGNIELDGGVDFSMDDRLDRIVLMYDADESKWVEISRSDNA